MSRSRVASAKRSAVSVRRAVRSVPQLAVDTIAAAAGAPSRGLRSDLGGLTGRGVCAEAARLSADAPRTSNAASVALRDRWCPPPTVRALQPPPDGEALTAAASASWTARAAATETQRSAAGLAGRIPAHGLRSAAAQPETSHSSNEQAGCPPAVLLRLASQPASTSREADRRGQTLKHRACSRSALVAVQFAAVLHAA